MPPGRYNRYIENEIIDKNEIIEKNLTIPNTNPVDIVTFLYPDPGIHAAIKLKLQLQQAPKSRAYCNWSCNMISDHFLKRLSYIYC